MIVFKINVFILILIERVREGFCCTLLLNFYRTKRKGILQNLCRFFFALQHIKLSRPIQGLKKILLSFSILHKTVSSTCIFQYLRNKNDDHNKIIVSLQDDFNSYYMFKQLINASVHIYVIVMSVQKIMSLLACTTIEN